MFGLQLNILPRQIIHHDKIQRPPIKFYILKPQIRHWMDTGLNLVDCVRLHLRLFIEPIVVNCYPITFESVDLPEELARNVVVQMNKALACIHSYFHCNTITITATTIAINIIHSYFHYHWLSSELPLSLFKNITSNTSSGTLPLSPPCSHRHYHLLP